MNTTQLECFMTVANFLNFSRAAEHLRITQPAVSHQINALEDELGVKLFHRTSKSVRLTQEGFQFTQYAGEILKLSNLSKARMKEASQAPARLVIGCRSSGELRMLRPALRRLRTEQPELLPVLRLVPFDSLENLLEEGELDLIFSFRESAPQRARYRELVRCPVACMCALDHPLAEREQVTLEELRQAGRIAVCRPPICPQVLFTQQSRALGDRATDQILFCDHQETAEILVESGYAFAVAADIPSARLPGLRYIPIPECRPLPFGAVYRPEAPPALKRLVELLRETEAPPRDYGERAVQP